jgi:metal-sulfur cluster biosynthetic enzyme
MLSLELLTVPPTEATVTDLLREVIDPELEINIVPVGLLRLPPWDADRDMSERVKQQLGWRT